MRVRSVVLAVGVMLGGCREGAIIEDRWPTFRVIGRVTDAAGAPVPGASVWVRSMGGDCATGTALGGPFTTGAGGRYVGGFGDVTNEFAGCVVVRVGRPGARVDFRDARDSVRVEGVRLGAAPRDSLVIDVQLSAEQ